MRELMPVLGALLRVTIRLSIGKLKQPAHRRALTAAMRRMRASAAAADANSFHLAGIEYAAALRRAAGNRYLDYLDGKLYAELFYPQTSAAVTILDWNAHLAHFEAMHRALLTGDLQRALTLIDEHEQWMLAALEGESARSAVNPSR